MRKALLAALAVAILGGASVALARTAPVEITKNGFAPRPVTVQGGDAVSWKNSDTTAHEVAVAKTNCKLNLQPSQSGSWASSSPRTSPSNNPRGESGDPTHSPVARPRTWPPDA